MDQNDSENTSTYAEEDPIPEVVLDMVKGLPQQAQTVWWYQYLYCVSMVATGLPIKVVA